LILCIDWNQERTIVVVIILIKWHRSSCQEWRNLLIFLQKLILLGTFNHKLALFIHHISLLWSVLKLRLKFDIENRKD
jgi:hypothetical protein